MPLETLLLAIRHGLTALGTVLIASTPMTDAGWEQVSGAVLTLIGLGWSYWRKQKRAI